MLHGIGSHIAQRLTADDEAVRDSEPRARPQGHPGAGRSGKTGGLSRRAAYQVRHGAGIPAHAGRRAAALRRPGSHERNAIQKPLLNMTFWHTIGLN